MTTLADTSYEEISTWLMSRVAAHTELPETEISADAPFDNYGMDSLQAVSLSVDIEDKYGLILPPTLAWDYPTIDKLAEHLVETLSEVSSGHDEENASQQMA